MKTRFSIGIPTKNRAHLLRQCITSCVHQSIDCEVFVLDAGSTDNTEAVCLEFGDKIKYHKLPSDPGFCDTWRLCAALCSGEYFHFQPDDDWIDETFAERTMSMFDDKIGLVMTQGMIHFPNGQTQINLPGLKTGIYPSSELVKMWYSIPLTVTPACFTVRRADVLNHLHPGKIPFTSKAMIQNEIFVGLACCSEYEYVGVIDEPLAHLGAGDECYTISNLNVGGRKQIEMLDGYREIKEAHARIYNSDSALIACAT